MYRSLQSAATRVLTAGFSIFPVGSWSKATHVAFFHSTFVKSPSGAKSLVKYFAEVSMLFKYEIWDWREACRENADTLIPSASAKNKIARILEFIIALVCPPLV